MDMCLAYEDEILRLRLRMTPMMVSEGIEPV